MPKPSPRPGGALVVRTYDQLSEYVRAFAGGRLGLLIVVGRPGLAKSQLFRQAVNNGACWIEGNATPFGMYCVLYQYRDQLVVIDDVDSLYASPAGLRLLKCLCQTDEKKRVAWQSAAAQLEKEDIPRDFVTASKVAILCNQWETLNDNVSAVQDRGHVILFDPFAEEVHRQAAQWFDDAEIYRWMGEHLHLIAEPSLRHYVRAAELKKAGLDWTQALPLTWMSSKALLVLRLRADRLYPTEEARARAFVAMGGGCRATYFNHARKLRRAIPSYTNPVVLSHSG
jgi:hypothetical protein